MPDCYLSCDDVPCGACATGCTRSDCFNSDGTQGTRNDCTCNVEGGDCSLKICDTTYSKCNSCINNPNRVWCTADNTCVELNHIRTGSACDAGPNSGYTHQGNCIGKIERTAPPEKGGPGPVCLRSTCGCTGCIDGTSGPCKDQRGVCYERVGGVCTSGTHDCGGAGPPPTPPPPPQVQLVI